MNTKELQRLIKVVVGGSQYDRDCEYLRMLELFMDDPDRFNREVEEMREEEKGE